MDMSKLARDHRNTDLAKIHMAKKELGLADGDYRAILHAQGGVESAARLDHAGRTRVLAYMRRMGFQPKARAAGKPHRPTPSADNLPMVRRIRAQLISLGRKPDEYADGIARQMFGQHVQFFEWCNGDELYKISAALGFEQRRKGAATE